MLYLPNITLVAMTGVNKNAHYQSLVKSMEGVKFGEVLLISSEHETEQSVSWDSDGKGGIKNFINNIKIDPISSIDDWNEKIIYELPNYIQTDYAMLVHADGYVVRPDLWKKEFLDYDYIGAPWPLPTDGVSYRDESGKIVRVGNSVSLRSKKLMDLVATREWKSYYGNTNEDGFICCHNRKWLEEQGCKFAPLELAVHFSKEHEILENVGLSTFAFHKVD